MGIRIFIPFGLFVACIVAFYWLMVRIRISLVDRHPEIWLEMSRRWFFNGYAPNRFVWSSRHRDLSDPDLTRQIMRVRWLTVGAGLAWLVFFAGAVMKFGILS